MPNWVLLLLRTGSAVAISTVMTWSANKVGRGDLGWTLIAFLLSVPIGAWLIAKPLVELLHEGLTWLSRHPLEKWQGNYYAFNSVHVRVFDDGERLWFCAQDMVTACHLKALAPAIPGVELVENLPSLDIEGVEKFQGSHPHPELARFLLWAKREVIAPWERKKSGALVPPERFGS
jgi:hypothetical protein